MSSEYSSEVVTKSRSKRSIFDGLDRSDLRTLLTSSKISLEMPEEIQMLRKVKYQNVPLSEHSTEEEMVYENESHVDSEDSGLFKEGYFLKRPTARLGKNRVDQEVNQWKQAAEKNLNELTSEYNKGSKTNVSYSIPLGIEMNRKIFNEVHEEDSTAQSRSFRSSIVVSEDEEDSRRNEEFMREVQRVLRSKKNPGTLVKRSLQEEYGRQFSKKMREVCRWAQHQLIPTPGSDQKTSPEKENPSQTDTGAGGDNTSGAVQGIFEQLSQMVLKNKISKKSKAAQNRKQILKRAEEKREKLVDLSKHSEMEEDHDIKKPIGKNLKGKKVRFLDDCIKHGSNESPKNEPSKTEGSENVKGTAQEDAEIAVYEGTRRTENRRMKKVEMYLASEHNQDCTSNSEEGDNDEIITAEEEKYVFDGLAGEFLKNLRTQPVEQGKMSRNDRKLLTFLAKKYIDRGELSLIDEMLSASVDDCKIPIPPYENVEDREKYFLWLVIRKYIKRGMRTNLEDKIAWIYYRTEVLKKKAGEGFDADDETSKYRDIQRMVKAFRSSGGNSSLNRLVEELVQERLNGNANMVEEEIAAARIQIRDMIVARFARMYLEGTAPGSKITEDADATSVDVIGSNDGTEKRMANQRGVEQFDLNGRMFKVQWKASGDGDESPETDDQQSCRDLPKEPPLYLEIPNQQAALMRENSFGRLKDQFWNKLQLCLTQSSGKRRKFCTPVSKREISLIGGARATPKNFHKTKQASSLEYLRTKLRQDNVKWLTEQKNKLWEARNKEAKSLDKFTMSLPKRMEQIIQRRNRLQNELIEQESSKLKSSGKRKKLRS